MGVVLNPLALKLGYTISWLDAWVSHRIIYSTFLHDILKLRLLLNYLFFSYFNKKRLLWVYSHCNIFVFCNQILLHLYFYNMRGKRYRLRKAFKGLRYINWKGLRVISNWYKYETLDKKKFAQRFFRFTRFNRFFYDFLDLANTGPLLGWNDEHYKLKKLKKRKNNRWEYRLRKNIKTRYTKTVLKLYQHQHGDERKIIRLKKKNRTKTTLNPIIKSYSRKKRRRKKGKWLAREDMRGLRFVYMGMLRNFNGLSAKWWPYYHNMVYSNKYSYVKNDKRFSNEKNLFKNEIVRNNLKLFTLYTAFLNKIFKKINVSYPSANFYFRGSLRFARFFIYFFIRKKILFFYKKLVQLISLYLNVFLNVKIFLIGKKSLTANFLVNYLSYGFRNKESFNYLLKPIRKVLTRMLHIKYRAKEKWIDEINDNDVLVPYFNHFNNESFIFVNILKAKKNMIIKKLYNVFRFYNYLVDEEKYRFIKFKVRRRKLKYKHFILKNFIFYNYNILSLNANRILLNSRVIMPDFSLPLRSTTLKVRNFFIKKFLLILDFYKKKLYLRKFIMFYFFIKLKYNTLKNKIKSLLLKNIILLTNLKSKIIQPKTFDNAIIDLLANYIKHKYIRCFVDNLFEINNLSMEYKYLAEYYNEIFDYKDLTYYETKYKRVFDFCKKCYLWLRKDADFIINEFQYQWKKYKFIDQFDLSLYRKSANLVEFYDSWFKDQAIFYYKLTKFFRKQSRHTKSIQPYAYKFLNKKTYIINWLLKSKLNLAKLILALFYSNNVMNFVFIKSFIQTGVKNIHASTESFYIFFKCLYDNLLSSQLFFITNNCHDSSKFINSFQLLFGFKKINKYTIDRIAKKKIENEYLLVYFFKVKRYKKYLNFLNFFDTLNYDELVYERPLIQSPLSRKKTRMEYFFGKSPLYGYKFHFAGRFTRKQKSANLWFQVGYLENSSMIAKIDYAFKSVVLRFSVCSIKVWLYKSNRFPSYRYNVFV